MTEQQKPNRALKPIDEIRSSLTKMEPQFRMALPSHISVERFSRILQTAISNSPAILKADRTSLYAACMKAAQDGLLPDGKEAALVPYGSVVQYMPMVGGILKKIRNSGELSSITSQVIHENDFFSYHIDQDGEHLEHRPNLFGDRGNRIGVYALAKTKDGAVYVEVLTTEQINAIKAASRGSANGPWSGPFESEMWRKSAVRRLAKRLPSSTDLDMTLRHDDENYDFQSVQPEPAGKSTRKRTRLEAAIEQATATPNPQTSQDEPLEAEWTASGSDATPIKNTEDVPI